MRSLSFYARTNRSGNLLHIETDGGIVNIRVGLRDSQGRAVTSVAISPDDESRGGDGQGNVWHLDGSRLVCGPAPEVTEDRATRYRMELLNLVGMFEFEVCEECGHDVDRHTFGPDPLGKPHAWCMDAAEDDDEETEDEPDEEDGFITDSRDGYAVSFAGKYVGTWPRYGMAEYEMAALIIREGYFPDIWHINDHGNYDNIGAAMAAFENEDGSLKVPAGRQYEDEEIVIVSEPLSDWPTWVVIRDYGTEGGIYMHTSGDPSVTMIAEGDDRESIRVATGEDFE